MTLFLIIGLVLLAAGLWLTRMHSTLVSRGLLGSGIAVIGISLAVSAWRNTHHDEQLELHQVAEVQMAESMSQEIKDQQLAERILVIRYPQMADGDTTGLRLQVIQAAFPPEEFLLVELISKVLEPRIPQTAPMVEPDQLIAEIQRLHKEAPFSAVFSIMRDFPDLKAYAAVKEFPPLFAYTVNRKNNWAYYLNQGALKACFIGEAQWITLTADPVPEKTGTMILVKKEMLSGLSPPDKYGRE